MTNQHPITPPHELIEEWIEQFKGDHPIYVAIQAAQWGANQELEACCQWLHCHAVTEFASGDLRAARRPKPPSLKEQAIAALDDAVMRGDCITVSDALPTIRRALEQLDG